MDSLVGWMAVPLVRSVEMKAVLKAVLKVDYWAVV